MTSARSDVGVQPQTHPHRSQPGSAPQYRPEARTETATVRPWRRKREEEGASLQYTPSVRSQASRITVRLVLLICLVCPLLETCDRWDHTLRTGQDSEYTFVVLALCVGAVYALAKLIVTLCPRLSAANFISTLCCAKDSLFPLIGPTALAPLSESPPLNLRI